MLIRFSKYRNRYRKLLLSWCIVVWLRPEKCIELLNPDHKRIRIDRRAIKITSLGAHELLAPNRFELETIRPAGSRCNRQLAMKLDRLISQTESHEWSARHNMQLCSDNRNLSLHHCNKFCLGLTQKNRQQKTNKNTELSQLNSGILRGKKREFENCLRLSLTEEETSQQRHLVSRSLSHLSPEENGIPWKREPYKCRRWSRENVDRTLTSQDFYLQKILFLSFVKVRFSILEQKLLAATDEVIWCLKLTV